LGDQGKHGEAREMFEEALAVYTSGLGIDNHENTRMHYVIATAKYMSGDNAGAVGSFNGAERIYTKLGFVNRQSQAADTHLGRLGQVT